MCFCGDCGFGVIWCSAEVLQVLCLSGFVVCFRCLVVCFVLLCLWCLVFVSFVAWVDVWRLVYSYVIVGCVFCG